MTYTPNIPQATDDPSQSQPLILSNFNQLNVQYGTSGDHVEWTASSNNGKHKKVTWVNQTASVPTGGLNEVVSYGITTAGVTMPYYKRDNLVTQYPLAPIKAYATLNVTGALAGTLLDSFNVASITVTNPSAIQIRVVFTNAMRNPLNYGLMVSHGVNSIVQNTVDSWYNNVDATTTNIYIRFLTGPAIFPVRVTFIALET